MSTVYLVSCVSKKLAVLSAAEDLYTSSWFKKARRYVEQIGCPWYILSAKNGLLSPEQMIAPYEQTLKNMRIGERRLWAERVYAQLAEAVPEMDRAVFLAGHPYREFLAGMLSERGIGVEIPMEGLRIGEQLRWLGNHVG